MDSAGLSKSNIANIFFHCIVLSYLKTKEFIKSNCRRIDVMIPVDMGIFTLELVEAILHYKYEPKYEGFDSQR